MFKSYIQKRLENYVREYFTKHPEVKLIGVTGSVGKTSTKVAIASVLSEAFRVRLHMGNHNSQISTPLAVLGIDYPKNIRNIFEWLAIFRAAKKRIIDPTDVDVIIQELGSDRIGEVEEFGTYLRPDISVVTAIAAEHMEFFKTIDAVAQEELGVANYSKSALINKDDIEGKWSKYLQNPNINTYGTSGDAEYHFISGGYTAENGFVGLLYAPELHDPMPATINIFGEHMIRPAVAAAAVGLKMGMNTSQLVRGLEKVRALPGRMNKLRGANKTTIVDDTYNSSPLAVKESIRTLYQMNAPQKIVVLGDMNELGATSASEHEELGKMCDPNQLAWVITVGKESEKYLAPAARAKGCQVKSFSDAISAGSFVREVMEPGAVILLKGSEGGIFLEEAVKLLLHSTADESQLVRQSPDWMVRKRNFFSKIS